MNSTSISLLDRLKRTNDSKTWNRLIELYGPLLRMWLSKYDVQPCDADDLVQDVLMTVAKDLGTFDHSGRKGAFRSWLRTILTHRIRYFWRSRGRQPQARADSDTERRIQQLEDPASALSAIWNWEHDWFIAQQLLALTDAGAQIS